MMKTCKFGLYHKLIANILSMSIKYAPLLPQDFDSPRSVPFTLPVGAHHRRLLVHFKEVITSVVSL